MTDLIERGFVNCEPEPDGREQPDGTTRRDSESGRGAGRLGKLKARNAAQGPDSNGLVDIRDKVEKEGDLKQQPERWDGRHYGDTRVPL